MPSDLATRISHGSVVIQLTFQDTTKEECVGLTLLTAESSDAETFALHCRAHSGKNTKRENERTMISRVMQHHNKLKLYCIRILPSQWATKRHTHTKSQTA
jgi:hypothetical protein